MAELGLGLEKNIAALDGHSPLLAIKSILYK